jgi:hypothetical protein
MSSIYKRTSNSITNIYEPVSKLPGLMNRNKIPTIALASLTILVTMLIRDRMISRTLDASFKKAKGLRTNAPYKAIQMLKSILAKTNVYFLNNSKETERRIKEETEKLIPGLKSILNSSASFKVISCPDLFLYIMQYVPNVDFLNVCNCSKCKLSFRRVC